MVAACVFLLGIAEKLFAWIIDNDVILAIRGFVVLLFLYEFQFLQFFVGRVKLLLDE